MHFGRFMGHRWEMQYNAAGGAMGASGKTHSGAIGNGGFQGEGLTPPYNQLSGAPRKKKYIYIYIYMRGPPKDAKVREPCEPCENHTGNIIHIYIYILVRTRAHSMRIPTPKEARAAE